jgi:16S rRNA (cytosine1402-N4)-methyltransferase
MSDPIVYHIPALLPQVLEAMQLEPSGTYADATFGGGGHSRAIFERLGADGRLFSFDQDSEALANAWSDLRFTPVHGNFRYIHQYLRFYGAEQIDAILADLGVSFHHFDEAERGFSFRFNGPLDMRMNRMAGRTAADVIAQSTEQELADTFRLFGELRQAPRLAAAIVRERAKQPILTIEQLLSVCSPLISKRDEKKELAQLFQALRIVVNDEIAALEQFLTQSLESLRQGGRLVIITYHSLEDRLVKNFMRAGNFTGRPEKDFYGRNLAPMKLLTSKPIVPDADEVARNPRSRSAKLRVAQRL